MSLEEALAAGLMRQGQSLDASAQDRLIRYIHLIAKWNQIYNLTAVRAPEQMVSHHLLDSLAVLPHLLPGADLLDVGTGAGLPGIPLAIARPDTAVVLLDSNQKKAAFLRQAKGELALDNVEVVSDRVEHYHPQRGHAQVIARAFADLSEFVTLCAKLVAPGGRWLAMKGLHPYEELVRLPAAWHATQVIELDVPGLDAHRHLVVIERSADPGTAAPAPR